MNDLTWDSLYDSDTRPVVAARLMHCTVASASVALSAIAEGRSRARRERERPASALSNTQTYEALQLWGPKAKIGRGISLWKTGDITFGHLPVRG